MADIRIPRKHRGLFREGCAIRLQKDPPRLELIQVDEAKGEYVVGSTVIMVEYRVDQQRVFAGRQRHRLRRDGMNFRIVQPSVLIDLNRVRESMLGATRGLMAGHVAPEAAVGGPIAFVCEGDMIRLDVTSRRLDLMVDEEELAARRAAWSAPRPSTRSVVLAKYAALVGCASEGAMTRPAFSAEEAPCS